MSGPATANADDENDDDKDDEEPDGVHADVSSLPPNAAYVESLRHDLSTATWYIDELLAVLRESPPPEHDMAARQRINMARQFSKRVRIARRTD